MSQRIQESIDRIKRGVFIISISMFAVVIAVYALVDVRRHTVPERTMILTVETPGGPQELDLSDIDPATLRPTLESSRAVLEQARDAAGFAESILSFMEVILALIALAIPITAYIIRFLTLGEFQRTMTTVEELEARFTTREEQLQQREEELKELEQTLTARLGEFERRSTEEFRGLHQRAEQSFRVVSLQLLAEQQVRGRNMETAVNTLREALEIEPANHATNYLLGYLYIARKQFDDAIGCLNAALAEEPNFTPAIAALGLALRRKGDSVPEHRFEERTRLWSDAERQLLRALELDPSLTDEEGESYFGSLGGLYRRQERFSDALWAYERAKGVTPSSSYPLINLAALNTRLGNPAEATRYFEAVLHHAELQLDDDPRDVWTRMDYAQALLMLGKPQLAHTELEKALNEHPGRNVLETVRDGLQFLHDSPGDDIYGLARLLETIEAELIARDAEQRASEAAAAADSAEAAASDVPAIRPNPNQPAQG